MRHILLTLGLALAAGPAFSHGFYSDWKRPEDGGSCCSNQDCGPVMPGDVRHAIDAGGNDVLEIRRNGHWFPVGQDVILPFPSPDSHVHACVTAPYSGAEGSYPGRLLCVALPASL